ncbi:acyl-CoA dehydrogenase family protein [Paenibacillus sp. TRM 82003]|uniref:acyl-CoA dehydrogenase family protein n=1 Tax=Kineococcus sp. TRM81007 TaxID=2925831 RepID=UPI001F5A20A2|nr:acyl-CoA dehydrogenase family protein [Kineococcus sp. TRM81007]MCI2238537.1 acyl-CoA dehydrogenase family protein [Kineococcus sp. TRM81007]MCI3921950.1 acyl-CoA dehydrogenase family protein [Paenibacillus sp. TRM 82003]
MTSGPATAGPEEVLARLAASAAAVDAGERDAGEGLRLLGDAGLLAPPGAPGERPATAVALLRAVASASLADAFCAWSQTMVVEYLERFPPAGEGPALLTGLRAGTLPGATALAPALADLTGGPPVPVLAEPAGGGAWRLTGAVSWASNLFDGAVVVLPARTAGDGRLVVLVRVGEPGVRVRPAGPLLALDGTGTGAVELDGASTTTVLGDDLAAFVGACRPVMLLTQAAMALGVADAALAGAAGRLTGPGALLAGAHRDLCAGRDDLAARLGRLAADPAAGGPTGPAAARVAVLDLLARAVHAEGLLTGGTGYRRDHPAARRRREAAFLPVQAPTELQLRTALAAAAAG